MKLGLALGGGGARGAAHVGVLLEFERLGVQPQMIAGTSIGGMVGALKAAGLTPKELREFFQKMTLNQLYALPRREPALGGNTKIEKLLVDSIGRITFADLKIPLSMVTVDLINRHEVILDEGDLISAILASIALPVLLPPVHRDGLVLVDGGIINNVPFDVVRARGATRVIAVDLTNTSPYGTPDEPAPPATGALARALNITRRRPTFQILSTIADIITAQSVNARLAVSKPELLLRPDLGTIGLFDFHRWEEGVEAGRKAVREAEDRIVRLVDPRAEPHDGGYRWKS